MKQKDFELLKEILPECVNETPSDFLQLNLKTKTIFVNIVTLKISVREEKDTEILSSFYLSRGYAEGAKKIDVNLIRCLRVLGCKINNEKLYSIYDVQI